MSPQRAAQTAQAALSSRARGKYKTEDREVDILLQLEEADRANLQQLQNMTFERAAAAGLIPAGNLANFSVQKGPEAIRREDRESIVTVSANTDRIGMRGVSQEVSALIGAFIVFYLTNPSLSGVSWMGVIVLAGIVVNNAIVLIDHINHLRKEGMDRTQAIIDGGRHRLRPILMTSLTTIIGLLPMVAPVVAPQWFGPLADRGANYWAPVSLALAGGMTTSAILTLILMPTVYSIIDDATVWVKQQVSRAWA
jgi:multidrug efflux pump subunit AcrB